MMLDILILLQRLTNFYFHYSHVRTKHDYLSLNNFSKCSFEKAEKEIKPSDRDMIPINVKLVKESVD